MRRCPDSARPRTCNAASARRPLSVAVVSRTVQPVAGALDDEAAGAPRQSSCAMSSLACTAGSRQPPCHSARASARPAATCANAAGAPGRRCSHRAACARSLPLALIVPPPLAADSLPCTLANSPGALSSARPLPERLSSTTSPLACSRASDVTTSREANESAPLFHRPLAAAERSSSAAAAAAISLPWSGFFATPARAFDAGAPSAASDTSNPIALPSPVSVALPLTGNDASAP